MPQHFNAFSEGANSEPRSVTHKGVFEIVPGQVSTEDIVAYAQADAPFPTATTTGRRRLRVSADRQARFGVTVTSIGPFDPAGRLRLEVDGRLRGTPRLIGAMEGSRTVALPKLRPGRYTVVVRFTGNRKTQTSVSAPLRLRVTR